MLFYMYLNPMQMQLTRMLYIHDEAAISLITALLNGEEIDCIMYWAAELYSSGFNLFALLRHTYFCFYYGLNPHLVELMRYDMEINEEKIINILLVLRESLWTVDVFCLWQLYNSKPSSNHVFRGRPSLRVSERVGYDSLSTIHRRLVNAVNKGDWSDVCSALHQCCEKSAEDVTMCIKGLLSNQQFENLKKIDQYGYDPVSLLAVIHEARAHDLLQDTSCYHKISPRLEHTYAVWNMYCADFSEEKKVLHRYDILPNSIRYGVHPSIVSSFVLSRDSIEDPNWEWVRYAEFYCQQTPYWVDKLRTCKFHPQTDVGDICFESSEAEEAFYDEHWIHPDEQNTALRQMIIPISEKSDGTQWLSHICQSKQCSVGALSGAEIGNYTSNALLYV